MCRRSGAGRPPQLPSSPARRAVLRGIGAEDVADPVQCPGCVDLGTPSEDLHDVEPVLGSVEDRLADDEVLGGQDRDVDRAEADHAGALGHVEVQVDGGEEHVEVRAAPVQAGLAVTGDGVPILRGHRHAETGQQAEHGFRGRRGQGQVHVDVRGRPGVAVPGQGDRPAELVRHADRVEHLVERDDPRDQTAELLALLWSLRVLLTDRPPGPPVRPAGGRAAGTAAAPARRGPDTPRSVPRSRGDR